MRFIALDVHIEFCELAVSTGGKARHAGRVLTAQLQTLAGSLDPTDRVVLESTGNALAIANLLRPHVAEVVIANPMRVKAIAHAKVKNDRVDACTLAELFAADLIPRVWIAPEQTRVLRRLTGRRAQLVRARTRVKNEISGVLTRNLANATRPPVTDLFTRKGREWLERLVLPWDERETISAGLRQIDFFEREIAKLDKQLSRHALHSTECRRLMTIPGVSFVTATTLMAAIGDITRFESPRHLVGYLGLDARVRQSGNSGPRTGRISKQGSADTRRVLTEAAWAAVKSPGPLRAFYERVKARRDSKIAAVAVARKLAVISWHLLTREEDYAYARSVLVARKIRRIELANGAPRRDRRQPAQMSGVWLGSPRDRAERDHALQAEAAYRRFVASYQPTPPPSRTT